MFNREIGKFHRQLGCEESTAAHEVYVERRTSVTTRQATRLDTADRYKTTGVKV